MPNLLELIVESEFLLCILRGALHATMFLTATHDFCFCCFCFLFSSQKPRNACILEDSGGGFLMKFVS